MHRLVVLHLVVLLGSLILFFDGGRAGPAEALPELNPSVPYQARRINPITYEIDYVIAITPPYRTKSLRAWLPVPQSDAGQEVEIGTFSTWPTKVEPTFHTEKTLGNRFAYFEWDQPEGAQILRHRFKIKVWELHWELDPARVRQVEKWPAGFEPFLRSDRAVVVNERFGKMALEIVGTRKNAVTDLDRLMGWLHQNMQYDNVRSSLQASSEFALDNKTGNCSEYHGLCAAFGRALGLPARMTYGLNTFPKASPSHCKLEVYLPPYGWVAFDISETQKLIQAIQSSTELTAERKAKLVKAAMDRLRTGFRDNTWFLHTRGTDFELAPTAGRRVNVIRTLYAEADGKPLPEPNPADPNRREFAWMTALDIRPDRVVHYPYKDWSSLEPSSSPP